MGNRTRRGSDGNGLAPSLEQGLPRAFVVRPVALRGHEANILENRMHVGTNATSALNNLSFIATYP